VDYLRDVFGNPFCRARPVARSVLQWNGGTIAGLTEAIYDSRDPALGTLDVARMAILGDALEEAGCKNIDMISHCRRPGSHIRGCVVVDAVLGKS
jgi:hypothetical protein